MDHTTDVLVGFARTLRNAGVAADTTRLHAFLTALDQVDDPDAATSTGPVGSRCAGDTRTSIGTTARLTAYFRGEHGALRLRRRPSPMLRHVSIAIPGDDEGSEGGSARTSSALQAEPRCFDIATLPRSHRMSVKKSADLLQH